MAIYVLLPRLDSRHPLRLLRGALVLIQYCIIEVTHLSLKAFQIFCRFVVSGLQRIGIRCIAFAFHAFLSLKGYFTGSAGGSISSWSVVTGEKW